MKGEQAGCDEIVDPVPSPKLAMARARKFETPPIVVSTSALLKSGKTRAA
jgi:hypothetical protein